MADSITPITGVAATGAPGSLGTPVIEIALTGVQASAVQGFMVKSTRPGESFDLLAPAIAIALTGVTGGAASLSLDFPLPVLAMTGDSPQAARITLRAPRPALAMAGVTGTTGELTLVSPRVVLEMVSGSAMVLEGPLPTLAMAGVIGDTAQFMLRAPRPALVMAGQTEYLGTLDLSPPTIGLALEGTIGITGTFARNLPKPTLRMTGVVGATGTLAIEAPLPELVLVGSFAAVGVLAIEGPAISLVMSGVTAGTVVQVAATRLTYALQTERLALTQYTNFPFNSFAVFGGRYLGASSDGIFELTGDTDNGTAIAATARFGITDMGTSMLKRVNSVYVGYRAALGKRALLLRVTTNETQQRDYGVKPSISAGLHTTRVDLGLGVESRYWQFELRNRDGADFSVDTVDVAVTPLRRRLGAKDA